MDLFMDCFPLGLGLRCSCRQVFPPGARYQGGGKVASRRRRGLPGLYRSAILNLNGNRATTFLLNPRWSKDAPHMTRGSGGIRTRLSRFRSKGHLSVDEETHFCRFCTSKDLACTGRFITTHADHAIIDPIIQ